MNLYDYTIKKLVEMYSKERLAEKFTMQQEVCEMYKKDNDELRKENESLKYLISKYRLAESEVAGNE